MFLFLLTVIVEDVSNYMYYNIKCVGPGSRNFNGSHKSGGLHGDAFFHHDIIPECPWPSGSTRVETLTVE